MKVFSVEAFRADLERIDEPEESIERSIDLWAERCRGLTEKEMERIGLVTEPEWMVDL
jgi:hypothetical protein